MRAADSNKDANRESALSLKLELITGKAISQYSPIQCERRKENETDQKKNKTRKKIKNICMYECMYIYKYILVEGTYVSRQANTSRRIFFCSSARTSKH